VLVLASKGLPACMANKPILSSFGLESRAFEQKYSTLMGSEEAALGVGLTLQDDVFDFDGLPWIGWIPPAPGSLCHCPNRADGINWRSV
jgi:hypothetical protein